MKGMMFTEFLEWVERGWSDDIADRVIDAAALASNGAYTAVGTYDHQEFVSLVVALANETGEPLAGLVKRFGIDLFAILAQGHPQTVQSADHAFALLERLDAHIHPEVQKLYPDAEVPRFDAARDQSRLTLVYRSSRPFADLAEGLIIGCGQWFGESLTIERHSQDDGSTRFEVERGV